MIYYIVLLLSQLGISRNHPHTKEEYQNCIQESIEHGKQQQFSGKTMSNSMEFPVDLRRCRRFETRCWTPTKWWPGGSWESLEEW